MIENLEQYTIIREQKLSPQDLINFEDLIVNHWEGGKIKGPVHLSNGNEEQLLEISKRIDPTDWVFSTWRSHYHALLKGVSPDWLESEILDGRSISIINREKKFYSSAIVGGIIPIATGVAMSNKRDNKNDIVWCFIGDMTFETGTFMENYKYIKNFELPVRFVVEDNGVSTNTPTIETWGKKLEVPNDVVYYEYEKHWPHYGTGKWVVF